MYYLLEFFILVSLPVDVIKYFDKRTLKEKIFMLVLSSKTKSAEAWDDLEVSGSV